MVHPDWHTDNYLSRLRLLLFRITVEPVIVKSRLFQLEKPSKFRIECLNLVEISILSMKFMQPISPRPKIAHLLFCPVDSRLLSPELVRALWNKPSGPMLKPVLLTLLVEQSDLV